MEEKILYFNLNLSWEVEVFVGDRERKKERIEQMIGTRRGILSYHYSFQQDLHCCKCRAIVKFYTRILL